MSGLVKLCTKCGEHKPLDQFHNDRNRKGGKYPNCKECHSAYVRNRYANQPGVRERHLKRQKEINRDPKQRPRLQANADRYYASLQGRAKTLWRGTRNRDPHATVSLEHITQMLEHGICPVTGIQFIMTAGYRRRGGAAMHPYAPSIDQIKPNAGYTDENTRLVIWQYNWMKGQLSDEEILTICQAIVGRRRDLFT